MKTKVTKPWRSYVLISIVAILAGILGGPAPVLAQRPRPAKPAPGPKPSVAVLLVAYESVATGDSRTNPELYRAMSRALEQVPGGREVLADVLRAYKALPQQKREALVGRELASATPATKLSPRLINRTFVQKRADRIPVDPDSPDSRARRLQQWLQQQRRPSRGNRLEAVPRAGWKRRTVSSPNQTRAGTGVRAPIPAALSPCSVHYKGLFCSWRGLDFEGSCAPYVILLTSFDNHLPKIRRFGPYEVSGLGRAFRHTGPPLWDNAGIDAGHSITTHMICYENDHWDAAVVRQIYALNVYFRHFFGVDWEGELPSILDAVHTLLSLNDPLGDDDLVPEESTGNLIVTRHVNDGNVSDLCQNDDLWYTFRHDPQMSAKFVGLAGVYRVFIDVKDP